MPPKKPEDERRLIDWFIAGFGVLLAVLLFFFVRQYQVLRREKIISARESWITNALKNHHGTNDTDLISSWMTFGYVNHLFNLPADYLKTQVSVADPTYPNLTINKFSREAQRNASSVVFEIQNAVRQYLANQSSTVNTSST
jgi:hypothetical protein